MQITPPRIKQIKLQIRDSLGLASPLDGPTIEVRGQMGREAILALPSGDASVNVAQLRFALSMEPDGSGTWVVSNLEQLKNRWATLCHLIAAGSSAHVPVNLAGGR